MRTKGAKDRKPRQPWTQVHPKVKEIREKNKAKKKKQTKINYTTFDGHKLTPKEAKFIDIYIATTNQRQAVLEAGYSTTSPGQYGQRLLEKSYIKKEIEYRLELLKEQSIADATEILQYFTAVMRGEEKDQFGLDAPLGERTKAAQELAKRKIDMPNRVQGEESKAEIKISLNWGGLDDEAE